DVAGSIPHSHVAADVLDDEIPRAIGDANGARSVDLELSGAVARVERADIADVGIAAAVGDVGIQPLRNFNSEIERGGAVVSEPRPVVVRHVALDVDLVAA